MAPELSEPLPDEARLALAHTPQSVRGALTTLLEFDARLGRLVSASTEPMLGQMRLAWWRDALGMAVSDRPRGDPVLDSLGELWSGRESGLVALIDGWERMLEEPPLPREAAMEFAEGRAQALADLATLAQLDERVAENVRAAGRLWAVADAASRIEDENERKTLLSLGADLPRPARLPSPLRGVAILGALADRALKAGGAPLLAGRGAALVALRAGLLGR